MIEEVAKINAVDIVDGTITVEIQRQSTCGSCSVRSGCGTAVVSKVLGQRRTLLRVKYRKQDVQVGEYVVIGLSEGMLLKGSFAVYTVPLLLMLGFAILGDVLGNQLPFWDADNVSVIFAAFGLFTGVLWLRHFTRQIRDNQQYQPTVLRKNSLAIASPQATA